MRRAPETAQAAASPLVTVPPLHTGADDAVEADVEILQLDDASLVAGIGRLRRERNAVVLAHNYQIAAVQDLT